MRFVFIFVLCAVMRMFSTCCTHIYVHITLEDFQDLELDYIVFCPPTPRVPKEANIVLACAKECFFYDEISTMWFVYTIAVFVFSVQEQGTLAAGI